MRYQDRISQVASRAGLLWAFEQLPSRPGLVVFSHHRIGNRDECEYNRDLFSATAEQFDYQLSYIKRHIPTLLPHELAELMQTKKKLTRLHAIITFDDGYIDNYELAFQLLKQHDLRAAFFVITSFIGTSHLPWWDEIAYLVRNTRLPSLSIQSSSPITVDLRTGREEAIRQLVEAYKSEENHDPAAFMQQLRAEAQVKPPMPQRRFLNWDEVKEIAAAGMEIGSHTRSHPLLSRLTDVEQQEEFRESKAILEQNLGLPVTSFAYPNGTRRDFTAETQRIARTAGFKAAFSFYGGINPPDGGEPYNVLRTAPRSQPDAFRTEIVLMSCLGPWNRLSNGKHPILEQGEYPIRSESL